MSVARSHIAKAVGRKINKIQNIGKRDSSCWYEWYHQMLSVTMATAQFVILTSRLFQTKPSKRFNLIKTRVVFFPFVSKIESNPDPGKRLYFVCRSRKKSAHKIVCAQRMVHRHNKIVGKKSSVSLPPLPPPPRPLPSKIKESQNYVKQLEYELQRLESMQPNALDAVRFHRFVS